MFAFSRLPPELRQKVWREAASVDGTLYPKTSRPYNAKIREIITSAWFRRTYVLSDQILNSNVANVSFGAQAEAKAVLRSFPQFIALDYQRLNGSSVEVARAKGW
jgi:hypothetical protein